MGNSLYLPSEIHIGCESLRLISKKVLHFQKKHAFIIIGSLLKQGILRNQIEEDFKRDGIVVTFYIHDKGEPTLEHLNEALQIIQKCEADCIVAIGGGSVIDLSKAIAVFSENRLISLDDISDKRNLDRLPLIVCPTTAGTGSEATKVMVITDQVNNVKKNPAHVDLIPDVVVLDPLLTVNLPKDFTAYTGLDALAHAIEAFVSIRATPLSNFYALEAIRLIAEFLPKAYKNSDDLVARENMLLASCYAGIAFSNASTNLAHATARPLGTRYHIPHGLCVALLLPFVIEFGKELLSDKYETIAKVMGLNKKENGAEDLIDLIEGYNSEFLIWEDGWKYISQIKYFDRDIDDLVKDALSGNGIYTNYRIPTANHIEQIYLNLWKKLSDVKV